MEMTIDEAISWLVSIAEHAGQDDISIYDEDAVAIEIAMNIMRKYEKIKEILDDDTYYEDYGNNAESFIVSAIIEVIKDDNND